MQAKSCNNTVFFEDAVYNAAMPGGKPTKNKRPELGERIAQARERAGLSQYELAALLKISQQQVVKWEREVSSIRSDNLLKIAQLLKVSTDELLGIKAVKIKTPAGRKGQLLNELDALPKRQQERILDQLEVAINGYKLGQIKKAS